MRVLVAGIGNIFLGDDGFGVEVAARLASIPMADDVRVADFGIRGVHLAYELLSGYDALVLVDAVPMGEPPGTVAVIVPDLADVTVPGDDIAPALDAHSMNPATVLGMLHSLGGAVAHIRIVGCEPALIEERIGLSPVVAAAVEPAVASVRHVLDDLRAADSAIKSEETHA
jgi:hydrogenase maturation protease